MAGISELTQRELYRPVDIAEKLGVTPARVYQLCDAGVIPHIHWGRGVRIPRTSWERWLQEQDAKAAASVRQSKVGNGTH